MPPGSQQLFARVTYAPGGARIVSLNPSIEGERLEMLMPILLHEAIHCDQVGGRFEEIAATAIDSFFWMNLLAVFPDLALAGTPLERLRTNNPDQAGVSYMVLHAVPHRNIGMVQEYFAPLRVHRNARNRKMLDNINRLTGLKLDFERDVLPLSRAHEGGSVTERHLMQALARADALALVADSVVARYR